MPGYARDDKPVLAKSRSISARQQGRYPEFSLARLLKVFWKMPDRWHFLNHSSFRFVSQMTNSPEVQAILCSWFIARGKFGLGILANWPIAPT